MLLPRPGGSKLLATGGADEGTGISSLGTRLERTLGGFRGGSRAEEERGGGGESIPLCSVDVVCDNATDGEAVCALGGGGGGVEATEVSGA